MEMKPMQNGIWTKSMLAVAMLLAGLFAPAVAAPVSLEVKELAGGLDHPWGLAELPDGALLVTERAGRLRLVFDGRVGAPISGVPDVVARGQGGLLDVALAPDFAQSGVIFLSYAKQMPGGSGTAVMRAVLTRTDETGALGDQTVIFEMNKGSTRGQHYGSRIVVAPDGNLFVTLGERGDMARAQDMDDLAGAVVRIGPDGRIPADNPFVGRPGHDALWSKGHRNPQGAALRPEDGQLFTVEHGAAGGDELNKPLAGRNYGWPVITYGRNYNGQKIGEGTAKDGLEQPVHYWDPSIAPSGLAFYKGSMFPEWQGDALVGSLKFGLLVRLDMAGDKVVGEERFLDNGYGRIRDVHVAADGSVLLLTDEADGRVLRVTRGDK